MEALKSYIEVKFSEADKKNASKADLGLLKVELADVKGSLHAEIADVKGSLHAEIADVKGSLHAEIADVKGSLNAEIANAKAEIIKWMFLFWVGQVAVTFGFILLFLKK